MAPTLDILSLFPEVVLNVLNSSMLRRAQLKGLVKLEATSLRDFGEGQFKAVDDSPMGGGQGMLFCPTVLEKALQDQLSWVSGDRARLLVIYMSPRGLQLGHRLSLELSHWLIGTETLTEPKPQDLKWDSRRICILAGRYEGVDERIVQRWVDLEVSLGDFIVTGGELPALVLVDSIVRLIPGVLGHEKSAPQDSFANGLIEEPQYTKPRNFLGLEVPEVLLGGNHSEIEKYRLRESILLTYAFRPDLIARHPGEGLPDWARSLLERLQRQMELRIEKKAILGDSSLDR
jgi:tRNA (guanine37-N1)-methyltransferase